MQVACVYAVDKLTNLKDVNGRSLIREGLHDAFRVAVNVPNQTLTSTGS